MPKYKVLKSVAHNLAHSYFSLMNYIDGNYPFEHLFKIVNEKKIVSFTVDVINKKIEPEIFMTETIAKTLDGLRDHAERLLEPHGFKLQDLISFDFYVIYDFENTRDEIHHVYDLKSVIVDDKDNQHTAQVVEWWKY